MQEFVSSLPTGVIDLELDDTKLHIVTPQYTSTINGSPADDFPVMPAITKGKSLELEGPSFKKALQQVIFAASGDDTRPVLTGAYLYSRDGSLYLVATDSYRLAEEVIGATKQEVDLLIPASALSELLRLIGEGEAKIKVTYDEQQASFNIEDTELVTRLIEGKYPDYQKLIPKEFAITASVNRNEMINITKVSSLFSKESAGSIKLDISEENQNLSIHSIASQLGENTSAATAKVSGSGSITINSRYLLDALHALSGDAVDFCCNGKLEPALVKDPGQKNYTHIIMPLKS
jgi:DNA polymerase-3 subunit beta